MLFIPRAGACMFSGVAQALAKVSINCAVPARGITWTFLTWRRIGYLKGSGTTWSSKLEQVGVRFGDVQIENQMELYELFQTAESLNQATFEATVASGFESLAVSEIKEKLPDVSLLCKARGRVFFTANDESAKLALMLRSIDHFYLIVSTGKYIVLSETKDDAVVSLEKLIESPNWNKVIDVWKSVFEFKGNCFPSKEQYDESALREATLKQKVNELWKEKEITEEMENLKNKDEIPKASFREKRDELKLNIMHKAERKAIYQSADHRFEEDKVLKFRMTCYRSGNHSFTSQEVARSLGGKLQEKFNWIVDLVNHDMEVVMNVREENMYLGVSLTQVSLHRRNIRNFGPTTLRATVCYNLLRLASPNPGDIILDPLCGGGSISIEGALAFSSCYSLAGDNHPVAILRAYDNVSFMKTEKKGCIDLAHWDVTKLPLRDACVDIVVTDLPFGKRSGSKQNNQILYRKALLEIGRCIVPAGRAVCLTWDKKNLIRTLRSYSTLWSVMRIATINLGGLQATAYVLKRSSESLATFLEKWQKKKRRKWPI